MFSFKFQKLLSFLCIYRITCSEGVAIIQNTKCFDGSKTDTIERYYVSNLSFEEIKEVKYELENIKDIMILHYDKYEFLRKYILNYASNQRNDEILQRISKLVKSSKRKAIIRLGNILSDIIEIISTFSESDNDIFIDLYTIVKFDIDLIKPIKLIIDLIVHARQLNFFIFKYENLNILTKNIQEKYQRFLLNPEKVKNIYFSAEDQMKNNKILSKNLITFDISNLQNYEVDESTYFTYIRDPIDTKINYESNSSKDLENDQKKTMLKINFIDKLKHKESFLLYDSSNFITFCNEIFNNLKQLSDEIKKIRECILNFDSIYEISNILYIKTTNVIERDILIEIICYQIEKQFYMDLITIKNIIHKNRGKNDYNGKYKMRCNIIKVIRNIDYIFKDAQEVKNNNPFTEVLTGSPSIDVEVIIKRNPNFKIISEIEKTLFANNKFIKTYKRLNWVKKYLFNRIIDYLLTEYNKLSDIKMDLYQIYNKLINDIHTKNEFCGFFIFIDKHSNTFSREIETFISNIIKVQEVCRADEYPMIDSFLMSKK